MRERQYYEDRDKSDFEDENPTYKCSCGGYTATAQNVLPLCPACGAPIEGDDDE